MPKEAKPSDLIVYHPAIVGKPVKDWGSPDSLSVQKITDYTIVALRLSGLRSADISKILFKSVVLSEQEVVFSVKDLKQAKEDKKWRVTDGKEAAGSISKISLAAEEEDGDVPCPVQAISSYLPKRVTPTNGKDCPFLIVCTSKRMIVNMSATTIANRYTRVARSVGIPECFTAHNARSSAAASCFLNTVTQDIREVQKVGQWRTTRMAAYYANKVVARDLDELNKLVRQLANGEPLRALSVRDMLSR